MKLDKIILYGDNNSQKTINDVEWYSDQFICFKQDGEIELSRG